MTPFDPRRHAHLLGGPAGFGQLVKLGISESDHLDYKVSRDRGAPDFRAKARVGAACLASSGRGFLVVGVDGRMSPMLFAMASK